jgi:hypothetical protein
MDQVMEIINWIIDNKEVILGAWGMIVAIASLITKIIPGDADNKIIDWLLNIIHKWLALNPTATSKSLRKK